MKQAIKKTIDYYKRNERYYMPAMLVLGFVFDVVTFRSVSLSSALWVLLVHVCLVVIAITIIDVDQEERFVRIRRVASFVLQFSFGALLSAALIFYSFSSSLEASWPLLLLVVILMVSNERFAHAYTKPLIHFPLLYLAVFLVLGVALPFLIGSIHPAWFFVSGIAAWVCMWLLIRLLRPFVPRIANMQYGLLYIMGLIFALMCGLFVANVIPPVPLSVSHSGVYHSIVHSGDTYIAQQEKQSFIEWIHPVETIHLTGEPVYVFTSIVSPGKLHPTIVYHWYFWNEAADAWESRGKITYPILGGRKEGFRGFSYSSSPQEGKWRVQVETSFGQILGRETFIIERVDVSPEIQEKIL